MTIRFSSKNIISGFAGLACALVAALTYVAGASTHTGSVAAPAATTPFHGNATTRVPDTVGQPPAPVGPDPGPGRIRLPGHIPVALLKRATPQPTESASAPMSLTLTLRRDDEAGFQQYLQDVYRPESRNFRHFLTQSQLTRRFGPSRAAYDEVRAYFRSQGFDIVSGSKNHLTLTLRGTRARVEETFALHIRDFEEGGTRLFINDADPAVPDAMAPHLQAVLGLMSQPISKPAQLLQAFAETIQILTTEFETLQGAAEGAYVAGYGPLELAPLYARAAAAQEALLSWLSTISAVEAEFGASVQGPNGGGTAKIRHQRSAARPGTAGVAVGSGQKVGVVAASSFQLQDVANWLALAGLPAAMLNQVTKVDVAGGAPVGAGEGDALLSINVILNLAPGAQIAVYDAPIAANAASFQAVFNKMIDDRVTVISNTNVYCEDQTTLADVQSLDSTLASAAASGITVLSATGDSGSACQNGSANTIAVPTDSPHITAVGGSSATAGPGNVYGSETWFDGSAQTPPTGSAGFGVSRFFSQPSYQASYTSSTMRSVPDVVAFADPSNAPSICQADAGGCPTNKLGGTSLSTPIWAAVVAGMNQQAGKNLGFLNPTLYTQTAAATFHSPASLSSDNAHVGLGSPNFTQLYFALSGTTAGPVSATVSGITASAAPLGYFNGATQVNTPISVSVQLSDANGFYVAGKTVTLSASGGSSTVSPASAQTNTTNGVAVFTVTDATPETLTFTATDSTDSVAVAQTITIQFQAPPATSASIQANPPSVPADGVSDAYVIVTLKDAQGKPTPGKQVQVQQTPGAHAVLTGPASSVTDANGQIQFLATDLVNESVTFTAVDVGDNAEVVPGSATVTYNGSTTTACYTGVAPTPGAGYTITPYITGQPSAPTLYYGNVNFGCPGTNTPAFSNAGVVLVSDFLNGGIYQVPLSGGTVSTSNLVTTLSPTLGGIVFGKDGSAYATVAAAGSSFGTGEIIQLDPTTGMQLRVLASGYTCPGGLAVDPVSGDLFFDGQCTGAGSDDPNIYRIVDPANTNVSNPTTVVPYAQAPATPNGGIAFAPNGTLYIVSGYYNNTNAAVLQVSGTSSATVTVTPVTGVTSDYGIGIGSVNSDGSAQSLIVEPAGSLSNVPITNPAAAVVLATGGPGVGVTGPDGCLYTASVNGIYRIADASGTCAFNPTNPSPTLTLSPTVASPNPTQGGMQTLTAKLTNVTPASGIPVLFYVGGANGTMRLATTDANGNAVVSYTGYHAGKDTAFAVYTPAAGNPLTSNIATVTWNAGVDSSFLTLNASPKGGTVGEPVNVVASLVDVSTNPLAAAPGQMVSFTLGGATCAATTDNNGSATCALTPAQAGSGSLAASFAGTGSLAPATAAAKFLAAGPLAPPPPTTTTVTVKARSGGGAIDTYVLALLAMLIGWRVFRAGASSRGILSAGVLAIVLLTGRAHAADSDGAAAAASPLDGLYIGVRGGGMPLHFNDGRVDRKLAADGFSEVSATGETSAPGGMLYLGYDLKPFLDLELGYARRNSELATLTGTIPVGSLHSLLEDAARTLNGYGSIYSLSLSGRWELLPQFFLTPRIGAYYWDSRVTVEADDDEVSATHKGGGFTAGVGAAYRVWRGLELGIGADYFHGSQDNYAVLYGASLEWHFGGL